MASDPSLPPPPPGPPHFNPSGQQGRCHFCGRVMPVEHLIRREERVGRTSMMGGDFQGHVFAGGGAHFGIVDVCPPCAKKIDEQKKKNMITALIVCAVFGGLLLLAMLGLALATLTR